MAATAEGAAAASAGLLRDVSVPDQEARDATLLISNLPEPCLNEADLRRLIGVFGAIEQVHISKDFTTDRPRGDAFVKMASKEAAAMAAALMNGSRVGDNSLAVELLASKKRKVIVVGAGLAGLAAALEAAQAGAFVLVLEKNARVGGNSAKASSGMNAAHTPAQQRASVADTIESFASDTLASGHGLADSHLVHTLVGESRAAWDWLAGLGLELDAVSKCGGHAAARTHRKAHERNAKPVNVGWEIVSAARAAAEAHPNIRIMKNATAVGLVLHDGVVSGVRAVLREAPGSAVHVEYNQAAVVLTTGGFCASRELLQRHAPHLAHLPTTNGDFALGEGLALGAEAGALLVHLDQIQVHPTGLIDPAQPNAQTKFLAPEALRAYGGILLNDAGARFVDELGMRDAVTAAIFASCGKYREGATSGDHTSAHLLMNGAVAAGFDAAVFEFYVSKGLIRRFASLAELASALALPLDAVQATLRAYNAAAASGQPCPLTGKTSFPTTFEPAAEAGPYYHAAITPSLHYTMGGLAINAHAAVLAAATLTAVPGLYAAGEVTGGVHGANRLAGNSLLECVVFGRIAGREAATRESLIAALSPASWTPLRLHSVEPLSVTTKLFRFALPSARHSAGLSLGQYVNVRAFANGEELVRSYSPVSRDDSPGTLDLCVKVGNMGDGKMAKVFSGLAVGDSLEFKGPIAGLELAVGSKRRMGMLAGGTGIAAQIQLLRAHLLKERKNGTEGFFDLSLIYAAKNEDELLLRDILERHASRHANIHLFYSLMEPPPGWSQGVGFVTADMIKAHMPPPADDSFIVICGPPPFCTACKKHLETLGYKVGVHFFSYL